MAWVLRLIETAMDGPAWVIDVTDIRSLGALSDIASRRLTLSEAKRVLARLQRAVAAVQAEDHILLRPDRSGCRQACHLQDRRLRRIATLVGTVAVRPTFPLRRLWSSRDGCSRRPSGRTGEAEPDDGPSVYRPPAPNLWRVPDALARICAVLAEHPEGSELAGFLLEITAAAPDRTLQTRAATASTLVAGFELAREGVLAMKQDNAFGTVTIVSVAQRADRAMTVA